MATLGEGGVASMGITTRADIQQTIQTIQYVSHNVLLANICEDRVKSLFSCPAIPLPPHKLVWRVVDGCGSRDPYPYHVYPYPSDVTRDHEIPTQLPTYHVYPYPHDVTRDHEILTQLPRIPIPLHQTSGIDQS